MVVGDAPATHTTSLVGEVKPRYESGQGFRIGGKIIERKVETGAKVNKGQVLARLDPVDAKLDAAAAQADVKAASANLALTRAELNRYRELRSRHFVSASALDIKEMEFKTAASKLSQLQAQADVSLNQTRYTLLTADRNGVVSMIRAEAGQVVQAGEVIAKVADTGHLDILVAVPESRMQTIKPNAPVTLGAWVNREQRYQGKVREIAPIAESATRAFNVRITVQNPDPALKFGMTVGVSFHHDQAENTGVLIPNSALTEIDGKPTVWIIDENNTAQPRAVSAGGFGEAGVHISQGLAAGDKIAIAGVHTLTKGQRVNPVMRPAS